ncbi:hypothetical protein [Paenibacillus harenae]|uniref:Membrane protein implicated in regulation of membrane protease activity n=1 Tax=Paenibacillus harenae TaxID=306543 RepID=A0ABT9TY08_PAEHA|nr:hypothetical protein [Paenibacillus harenae]MDQ0112237.1 membrane protein implicated in regulation of membrane protease activity [Paenibacillus harenae]
MKIINFLKVMKFKLYHYYQSIQHFLLTIMVVGILEYFFLFELLVALLPAVPIFTLEAGSILIVIVAVLLIKGFMRYVKKKAKENKHFLII